MKPKKSLGQHFLTSEGAVKRIVNAADITEGEIVLEIGPGRGVLTTALLNAGARVIAVEKDEQLAADLQNTFKNAVEDGSLTVVVDDVLSLDPSQLYKLIPASYKLVSNIPYYITGAIIRQFLTTDYQPTKMVLLVQREVAERVVAKATKERAKESLLSISVKAYGEPHMAGVVKAGSFNPPPKVDSAILVVESISRDFFAGVEPEYFFELLHCGFQQKRKQLAGNLKSQFSAELIEESFSVCHINKQARAEELSLENWKCLATQLT